MFSARDASSLLGWWHDAGVDMLVDEVPVPWLERLAAPIIAAPTAAVSRGHRVVAEAVVEAPKPRAPLPDTLPAFTRWLIEAAEIPGVGPASQRLGPQGAADAEMMILVDMPEAGDVQAGRLFSGEFGDMFDKMLAAMDLSRETVWLATLSPGRTASGAIDKDMLPRLAEIARHHIALVAPKRLWLLGEAVSRAILEMEPRQARGRLEKINHANGTVTAMTSYHPRLLHQHPARKREAWQDMQMLIGKITA
jgi:uracil-DNA glycosylase